MVQQKVNSPVWLWVIFDEFTIVYYLGFETY